MWNEPTLEELTRIPSLYTTENTPGKDILIYEHFFIFSSDWYIAEYDPKDRIFFAYAILQNDFPNAEWGYVGYDELRELRVRGFEVDRELGWRVRKAGEIERIMGNVRRN